MVALLLSDDDFADLAWWLGDSGVDLPGPLRRILGRIIDSAGEPVINQSGLRVDAVQQVANPNLGPTINNPIRHASPGATQRYLRMGNQTCTCPAIRTPWLYGPDEHAADCPWSKS